MATPEPLSDLPDDILDMEGLDDSFFALFRDEDHLPFLDEDARECLTHPPSPTRDPDAVNVVTAETLKKLRLTKCWTLPSLDRFPSIHIDIIYQVLSHLHPLDIAHLSRTNKDFRALLLSPSTDMIWRMSFSRWPDYLPPCPPGVCGRRWTNLVFGPQLCEVCRMNDTIPDFYIWHRLCTSCMDRQLVLHTSHPLMEEVFPTTSRFNGASNMALPSRLRLHIFDAKDAITEVQAAVQRGETVPFLENWFLERKAMVIANRQAAKTAISWWDAASQKRRQHFVKQFDLNTTRIQNRLIGEGYHPQDVLRAGIPVFVRHYPRLTARAWRAILPVLMPLVEKQRIQRLSEEREYLLASRRRVITAVVSQVLRTSPAQLWPHLPPAESLYAWPPVKSLIDDPSHRPFTENDTKLLDALVHLPEFSIAWRAAQREKTLRLLPAGTPPNLATNIFTCTAESAIDASERCTTGNVLFGLDGVSACMGFMGPRCWLDVTHRPAFAREGAAAVAAIAELVGLDPRAATEAEMDLVCGAEPGSSRVKEQAERRFLCACCPIRKRRGIWGRPAMRWRECVRHFMNQGRHASHASPRWMLLSEAATAAVVAQERATIEPVYEEPVWACMVCPAHFEHQDSRAGVFDHISDIHCISRDAVREGTHFMLNLNADVGILPSRPKVVVTLDTAHVADLRCRLCPATAVKLWSRRAIERHLIDKHGLVVPSESNWIQVELVSCVTSSE
ncbi:hypothetical protein MKEN_00752800 [Mycena kentingensis (nom. inval.)]|nr:hypothetical protein MKEN_00752800 [Mycena kentingensis (nom. inval.)]